MRYSILLYPLLVLLAAPVAADGQVFSVGGERESRTGPRRSPGTVGGSLVYAQPMDDFRTNVRQGFGVDLTGHWKFDRRGIFSLGAEGGLLGYGRETQRVPLSGTVGGRILVDLTTSNNIVWLGLGPQLIAPSGAVRPYANATAGFSYFFTESSVDGTYDDEAFAKTTNYDDATFAWTGGGGILIPVGFSRMGAVDIGVRYHANGNVRYLRKGGIVDLPNGGIEYRVNESRAPLLSWRIGFKWGLD
ncbi:MAG: hypothetical protein ABIZ91_08525 [Gemmatimonadaceae bacterium]